MSVIIICANAGTVYGDGHVRMFRNPAATHQEKEPEEPP